MSRNYGHVSTAIWRNDEFRALTMAAQHTYLLLATQPDISAAGVLPLSVTRWASRARDTTRESIVAALRELEARRFVAYDIVTEELLVRSFVRWDGGAGNPKRRPVILRAAADVESAAIRRVLAVEFARLDLPTDCLSDRESDSPSGSLPDSGSTPNEADFTSSQANRLSDGLPDTDPDRESPSDGVVVTTTAPYIQPTTHNPQSTTLPPSAGADAPPPDESEGQRVNRLTKVYTDRVKLSNFPAIAGVVRKAVKAGSTDDEITRGLMALAADDERSVTTDSLRYAMKGGRPGRQPLPATTPATPLNKQCPEHRGQPADRCGGCAADAKAKAGRVAVA